MRTLAKTFHDPGAADTSRGVWGKVWVVDLASRKLSRLDFPYENTKETIGGVGLGVRLLEHFSSAGSDPLAGEVPVVFAVGPLTATGLTTTAKFAVVTKSPLTGLVADSLSTGHFALNLKGSGVDALVLRGCARGPLAIRIEGERILFRDARDLAGLSSAEVDQRLHEEWGPEWAVVSVGRAGERAVRFATLSTEGRHAGRGGLGAVFSALGLKALGVKGNRAAPAAEPPKVERIRTRWMRWSLGPATRKYRLMGTTANLLAFNRLGVLPVRNFSDPAGASSFSGEQLAGEALHNQRLAGRSACASCTIGCTFHFDLRKTNGEAKSARMEYESLYALGPLCGVEDPDAVLAAAALCDRYGLDTISTGGTIAWALECCERGILSQPVDAPPLRFGRGDAVAHLVEAIGRREGMGDLLAEGSARAARRLGGGSQELVTAIKGMELPGYDPRTMPAMALGFAVGARGACHNRSSAYEADLENQIDFENPRALAAAVVAAEDRAALLDSLILCKFLRGALPDLWEESAAALRAVTGDRINASTLQQRSAAVTRLKRAYNRREGLTPDQEQLPDRLFQGAKLGRELFGNALEEYRRIREG